MAFAGFLHSHLQLQDFGSFSSHGIVLQSKTYDFLHMRRDTEVIVSHLIEELCNDLIKDEECCPSDPLHVATSVWLVRSHQ